MAEDDVLAIAVRVARAIEGVGGRYFLGGSLASSLDGEPRATNDSGLLLAGFRHAGDGQVRSLLMRRDYQMEPGGRRSSCTSVIGVRKMGCIGRTPRRASWHNATLQA